MILQKEIIRYSELFSIEIEDLRFFLMEFMIMKRKPSLYQAKKGGAVVCPGLLCEIDLFDN